MAIHTNGAFDNVPAGTERWAILPVTGATEYCSMRNMVPLPAVQQARNSRIPWSTVLQRYGSLPTGVKIVGENLGPSATHQVHSAPRCSPGRGCSQLFGCPAPAQEPAYWGSVDIKWTYGGPALTVAQSAPAASIRRSAVSP